MSGKPTFEQMYHAQAEFQKAIEKYVGALPCDDPAKFHYHVTAMVEELGEVLKADKRWKTHRNTTYNKDEKIDEIADVFITAFNIAIWSDINLDALTNAIGLKMLENYRRALRDGTIVSERR